MLKRRTALCLEVISLSKVIIVPKDCSSLQMTDIMLHDNCFSLSAFISDFIANPYLSRSFAEPALSSTEYEQRYIVVHYVHYVLRKLSISSKQAILFPSGWKWHPGVFLRPSHSTQTDEETSSSSWKSNSLACLWWPHLSLAPTPASFMATKASILATKCFGEKHHRLRLA